MNTVKALYQHAHLKSFQYSLKTKANMQSEILPHDFIQFIDKCKTLMAEVWDYKHNREDFVLFEENFEKFQKRHLRKFPLYCGLLGSFQKHKIKKQPKKIYYIKHYWHDLICQKTSLEIRNSLKKSQVVKHIMFQTKVSIETETLSLMEASKLLSKLSKPWKSDQLWPCISRVMFPGHFSTISNNFFIIGCSSISTPTN